MIDFKGKQFAGRVRHADGTFGISSTMSLDDLLKGLIDFLPMDVIYTINSSEDGIIDLQPIGRIGLCFQNGDIKKEQFHDEKEQLRESVDGQRVEEVDGSRQSRTSERRNNRPIKSKLSRQREKSAAKQTSAVEQVREDDGGDLDRDQIPLPIITQAQPTAQEIAAVKADQRKKPGRPSNDSRSPSKNKDGERAKKKFANQFDSFGARD